MTLNPFIVLELPFNFLGLEFKILVESVKPLLLEKKLCFGSGIADPFELLKFELVQLRVFRYRGEYL